MPKKISVVGGNLFQIAANTLGDATQANRIATANNTTDPFLVGPQTLDIPTVDLAATGGEPFGPVTQQPAEAPAAVEVVPTPPPVVPPTPVVDAPPPTEPPWLVNVCAAWQPTPPLPALNVKRSPSGLAVTVNAPIPGGQIDAQFQVLRAWIPPDPLPSLGTNLAPSLLAIAVDAPTPGGQIDAQFQVLSAWIPPDPLPSLGTNLVPSIIAVAVSPFIVGGVLDPQQVSIINTWSVPKPLIVFELPSSSKYAQVDNPPSGGQIDPQHTNLVNAWQIRSEPIQPVKHVRQQQIVSVDNPIPSEGAPWEWLMAVISTWAPAPPAPQVSRKFVSGGGAIPPGSSALIIVAG